MAFEDERTGDQIDVLLVEPSPGDARLFTEAFGEANLVNRVHIVSEGEVALEFIRQEGEYAGNPRPDLVLLEPKLPDRDGLEILSELKDDPVLREIPVVVLTSSDVGEEIVKQHDVKADHYVQKPVEPEDFLGCVQEIEELWLAIIKESAEQN